MTHCILPPEHVIRQAERLLEATIRKVGTDEVAAISVGCGIQKTACVAELDRALYILMRTDELQRYNDGLPGRPGRILSRIFDDELGGTDLTHARDCLTFGRITHRDSRFAYFRDGVLDFFDLSSTPSKVATAAVAGSIALLCVVAPPVGLAAGAVVLAGAATLSGAAIIKNGFEIMTQTDHDGRDDWRDLGHATIGFVAAAAPLPRTVPVLRETWIPAVGPMTPFSGTAIVRPSAVDLPANIQP